MGCVLGCNRGQDAISTAQKTHTQYPRPSRKKAKGPPPQKKTANKKTRKQRHLDGPRKGRKESFTKYIPGYVPTVPVEDPELFGVFDAVEYVDPYTVAREELQHPRKPMISPEQVPVKPITGTPSQTCTHANARRTRSTQKQSCTKSNRHYYTKSNRHYYSDKVYLYESEHHSGNYESESFNIEVGCDDNGGGNEAGNTGCD
ncbi:hypothetical protein DVH05_020971 [Phytophthora capsici]|nr:hypothetical protein DVH05_020971 [Phytophthora capsici]